MKRKKEYQKPSQQLPKQLKGGNDLKLLNKDGNYKFYKHLTSEFLSINMVCPIMGQH